MADSQSLSLNPPTRPGTYERHAYTEPPTRLRELSIYFPRPIEQSDPKDTVWIVYVHGGAWRDPLQTDTCVNPTLRHLASLPPDSSPLKHIAAVASIHYRLSPYPSHPTHPSSSDDEERNVQHPTHIQDVDTAIRWLATKYGLGTKYSKWIGAGHSCGATLLLQYVASLGSRDSHSQIGDADAKTPNEATPSPCSLILMSGIYDIPKFLLSHEPPAVPLEIARIYQDIIAAAFGEDQQVWEAASPSRMKLKSLGEKDGGEGRETKDITLAYSSEDELVENGQWLYMQGHLKMYGWELGEGYEQEKIVRRKRLSGAHDFVWEDGRQVVDLVKEAVERISKS